jgi:hypothetical protein
VDVDAEQIAGDEIAAPRRRAADTVGRRARHLDAVGERTSPLTPCRVRPDQVAFHHVAAGPGDQDARLVEAVDHEASNGRASAGDAQAHGGRGALTVQLDFSARLLRRAVYRDRIADRRERRRGRDSRDACLRDGERDRVEAGRRIRVRDRLPE